jgi:hypothetical protein
VVDEEDVMGADQEERGTPEEQSKGRHSAPDGADRHPLVDLERDPTPGVADHAKPDES